MKKTVFIMGSRGYKKNYGGWETLVDNLIDNWKDTNTSFIVFELSKTRVKDKVIYINNIPCHQIYVRNLGYMTMMIFAAKALFSAYRMVKNNRIDNPIFYVLGVRVGPVFSLMKKKLKKNGILVTINPDGLEWKRDKYGYFTKKYFLISEKTMIKSSNAVICDSMEIQKYINNKYDKDGLKTRYISYGSDYLDYQEKQETRQAILEKYDLNTMDYYLIVGRFIPENNFELILKEFINSSSLKKLVIVTNIEENGYYNKLVRNTNFLNDKRITVLGPVYDKTSLSILRKNAFGYIHGHSAGGTNPSLLEALSLTDLNILYDVAFNKEVGLDAAYYFFNEGSLTSLINYCDTLSNQQIQALGSKCREIISNRFTWDIVVEKHLLLFNDLIKSKGDL